MSDTCLPRPLGHNVLQQEEARLLGLIRARHDLTLSHSHLTRTSRLEKQPRYLLPDVVMLDSANTNSPTYQFSSPPSLYALDQPVTSHLETHSSMPDPLRCEHATSLHPFWARVARVLYWPLSRIAYLRKGY
jgi:hypothetical protein